MRWAALLAILLSALLYFVNLWAYQITPGLSLDGFVLSSALAIACSPVFYATLVLLVLAAVLVYLFSGGRAVPVAEPAPARNPTLRALAVGLLITALAAMVVWLWSDRMLARAEIAGMKPITEPHIARGIHVILSNAWPDVRVGLIEFKANELEDIRPELENAMERAESKPLTIRLYAEEGVSPSLLNSLFAIIQDVKPAQIVVYRLAKGVSVYDDFMFGIAWGMLRTLKNLKEVY